MAVKRILLCDRCGEEIKLNFFPKVNMKIGYQVQFSHNSYNFLDDEAILCSDCTKKFEKFIRNED